MKTIFFLALNLCFCGNAMAKSTWCVGFNPRLSSYSVRVKTHTPPVSLQEVNEKTVNAIYYRTTAVNNLRVSPMDFSLLESIAAQCPTTGGRAVYQARGILAFYNRLKLYKDREDCLAQGAVYRKPKPNSPKTTSIVSISPNPAQQFFSIQPPNDLGGSVLQVTDALGRILIEQKLTEGNNVQIDVNKLHEGIYFSRLLQANGIILQLPKLVIARP